MLSHFIFFLILFCFLNIPLKLQQWVSSGKTDDKCWKFEEAQLSGFSPLLSTALQPSLYSSSVTAEPAENLNFFLFTLDCFFAISWVARQHTKWGKGVSSMYMSMIDGFNKFFLALVLHFCKWKYNCREISEELDVFTRYPSHILLLGLSDIFDKYLKKILNQLYQQHLDSFHSLSNAYFLYIFLSLLFTLLIL